MDVNYFDCECQNYSKSTEKIKKKHKIPFTKLHGIFLLFVMTIVYTLIFACDFKEAIVLLNDDYQNDVSTYFINIFLTYVDIYYFIIAFFIYFFPKNKFVVSKIQQYM